MRVVHCCAVAMLAFTAVACGRERQSASRESDSGSRRQRPPIIDMHMHSRLSSVKGGTTMPRPCAPEPCNWVKSPQADESVLRRTLTAMDRHNVVLGYLSDYYTTGSIEAWSTEAAGRFFLSAIPFGPDGSVRSTADIEALRTAYKSQRFKGMGEITRSISESPQMIHDSNRILRSLMS